MKRPMTPGISSALAQARLALDKPAAEPVKDQAELVAEADTWRDREYVTEEVEGE